MMNIFYTNSKEELGLSVTSFYMFAMRHRLTCLEFDTEFDLEF